MKLGTRIFLCYVVISAACLYYPIDWSLDNLRTRYLEGVEDPLVDQANILAALVADAMEKGEFAPDDWYAAFQKVYERPLNARIYELNKTGVDTRIYIADRKGRVVFDSRGKETLGEDYSLWLDVALTLQGRYGARTTQADPDDPLSSVLFVAAPIMIDGEIEGVLTVAKPTTNINSFLAKAKPKIFKVAAVATAFAVASFLVVSAWITRPIIRLTRYADDVRLGKPATFPKLDSTEIGEMGAAFEKMRKALEGKEYVENYVQTLTHEIKSPLSAIRGAAELLEENMPEEQRMRFLDNIRNETNRISRLVERMLELSSLENRRRPPKMKRVRLRAVVEAVLESKRPLLAPKNLEVSLDIDENLEIDANLFLIRQAVANLIQNAMEFSPENGTIQVTARKDGECVRFQVADDGPGIPEFALEKIFDKFFSLQRPGDGKKSTGLGLNFVKETAALHGGTLAVQNKTDKGAIAILSLPITRS